MLKKKLSGILAAVMAASAFSVTGFARTEDTKLFSDNFESGLNSDVWNTSDTGVGSGKHDLIKYLQTSGAEDAEFSYEYSAKKEDVSFNAVINAAEWKQTGDAFEVYVRYVDESNYFKLTYTPGTFTLSKCVSGTETAIQTALKTLEANKDYKISLQAKHGVVRFELDGITLIQDYTGIDNFDNTADKNSAKFKTLSQELKIKALNISEEDTLLHQEFANTGLIMTESDNSTTDSGAIKLNDGAGTIEQQADSILITGVKNIQIKQSDWEDANKGTDFARTEAKFVMKVKDLNGNEDLHIRTNLNSDGNETYLARIRRDGYSLGDNYGKNKEVVKYDGYTDAMTYGFRKYMDDNYHEFKVITEPNAEYSNVTVTLYIDGTQHLTWTDTAPATPAADTSRILAGGFNFSTTNESSKLYLKSYELRDITGNDNALFTEDFADTSRWTGGAEIVTVDDTYYATTASDNGTLAVKDKNWKNILAETDVRFDTLPESPSIDNYAGVMARYVDENNYIMGAYSPYAKNAGKGTVFVESVVSGAKTTVKKEVTAFAAGTSHKLGINVKDGAAIIFVDSDAVLNAPFDTTNAQLYGSVALKSNNIATKFDNVSVSGTPYYFVEEFKETPDWSNYKVGTTASAISTATFNSDGTITAGEKAEIKLVANNSIAAWDDVEMTVRMKTPSGTLNGIYLRDGRTSDNWNYCVDIGESAVVLRDSAYWAEITRVSEAVKVPVNEWVDVKMRLTDLDTNNDGAADAVRIRFAVGDKTYLDYTNNGTIGGTGGASYPLLSKDYGRGFKIYNGVNRKYVIDSITVTDPEAGTLLASVSAPETFTANSDVTAKLTVDNNEYEAAQTMFITAIYDDKDRLIDAVAQYQSTASETKTEYTQTINTGAAAKLRVFAWDGKDNVFPVATPVISTSVQ